MWNRFLSIPAWPLWPAGRGNEVLGMFSDRDRGTAHQHTMGKWFNILGEQNISNLWPRISRKSGHRPTTEHEIASSFGTDAVNVFICWLAPTKRHYLQPDCCHNFTDKVCFTMAEVPRWSCFVSGIELSVWLFVPCPRADRFRFYVWWIK